MATINIQEISLHALGFIRNGYDKERAIDETLKQLGLEGTLSNEQRELVREEIKRNEEQRQEMAEEDPEAYEELVQGEKEVTENMNSVSEDTNTEEQAEE